MQKLGSTLTTTAGKELLASVDGGDDRIKYTRAVLASDDLNDMADSAIRQMKSLNILQSAPITVASRIGSTINLAASFTNNEITADFDFWAVGWYAKGDTTMTDEVLLAITPSETLQTMPASVSGTSTASISVKYAMALSEASEVVINPDPAGQVTKEAVEQMINELRAQGIIDNGTILSSSDDLNERVHTSIAIVQGSIPTNAPADVSDSGQLIVYGRHEDGEPVTQVYYDDSKKTSYVRYYNATDSTWSDWDKYLTASQIASALPENIPDDSKVVHLTGDETIKGTKTFDKAPVLKSNGKPLITLDDLPEIPKVDTTKLVTTDGNGNVADAKVNFKPGQMTIDGHAGLSLIVATDATDAAAKSAASPNALVVW